MATNIEPIQPTSFIKHPDIVLSAGVVAILMVMLLPLPRFLLDLLLSFDITLSVIILLVGLQVRRPIEFSVFPSILLVITLLRLSLNIASTRLILLHGNEGAGAAGEVIRAFGNFVVGGNYTVGLVVFSILVIINFVVVTKGAGRVAEVAARFTLDAMPGKQMSIDADLNAGLINEADARRRRREINEEADFYGAMDGASKFVRGDAIAAVIIILVNIVGGLAIGILQHGMSPGLAAQTYTLLTVGEGLVAQIPALIGLRGYARSLGYRSRQRNDQTAVDLTEGGRHGRRHPPGAWHDPRFAAHGFFTAGVRRGLDGLSSASTGAGFRSGRSSAGRAEGR